MFWKIYNNSLVIYALNIESDVEKKFKNVLIGYTFMYNTELGVEFVLLSNINFNDFIKLKKYFYDRLPFIKNLTIEDSYNIIIKFNRKYIDSIDVIYR